MFMHMRLILLNGLIREGWQKVEVVRRKIIQLLRLRESNHVLKTFVRVKILLLKQELGKDLIMNHI